MFRCLDYLKRRIGLRIVQNSNTGHRRVIGDRLEQTANGFGRVERDDANVTAPRDR